MRNSQYKAPTTKEAEAKRDEFIGSNIMDLHFNLDKEGRLEEEFGFSDRIEFKLHHADFERQVG